MFCNRLRQRPEWANVPSALSTSQGTRWQEKALDTHDVALPLSRTHEQGQFRRILLLSSSDMQHSGNGLARIERLSYLNGGVNVDIVFLLREKGSKEDGMMQYMELQASLISSNFEIPVLPLHSVLSLQATLMAYARQLSASRVPPKATSIIKEILPYCSSNPPLSEHTSNILSDIYHGLKDLAMAATTADGQQILREYVDNAVQAEEAISFWQAEYIAN